MSDVCGAWAEITGAGPPFLGKNMRCPPQYIIVNINI